MGLYRVFLDLTRYPPQYCGVPCGHRVCHVLRCRYRLGCTLGSGLCGLCGSLGGLDFVFMVFPLVWGGIWYIGGVW